MILIRLLEAELFEAELSDDVSFMAELKTSHKPSEFSEVEFDDPKGLGHGASGNSGTADFGSGSQSTSSRDGRLNDYQ